MPTLQQQLAELRRRIEGLPSDARPAEISPLEAEARTLLTASKNTPFEEEARGLFGLLAKRSAPPAPEVASLRSMLRRARIRMEMAAGDHDYDEAIDILSEVLAQDSHNVDALALLEQAAQRGAQHEMKVRDVMRRYGLELTTSSAVPVPPTTSSVSGATYSESEDSEATESEDADESELDLTPSRASSAVDVLLTELTQTYYAGDYQRTIDSANRILSIQPDNAAALDYRQKSEDNLIRGIVPDHRIPFDARVAYNRANSLVRAGNYEEAGRLYREARDIAERAGISNWKDAEQALLDIQDLALARELLADGDRLLANDDWQNALHKYEGALRVVPSDPVAQERIELVKRVQDQFDKASVQLNMMAGSLTERVSSLQKLLSTVATLRQTLPGSGRLQLMATEADKRIQVVKAQLIDQGKGALTRAEAATALDEKMRLTSEAVRALETASSIDPGDGEISAALQTARQSEAQISEARQVVERASGLIAQNFDNELSQARAMLSGLRNFAQDPRYRSIVSDLLMRYVERIEAAIDRRDAVTAERWLSLAKDDPFRMLGRRSELLQLEDEIRNLQRNRVVRTGMIVAGVVVVLLIIALLSSPVWVPLVTPPTPTHTATATFTPSNTFTPTATFTASSTFTPTATFTPSNTPTATSTATYTWTPSLTFTASFTPTASYTPTHTNTPTHTFTPSSTPTASDTPTITNTPTVTYTPSMTYTPSITPTPRIICVVFVTQGTWIYEESNIASRQKFGIKRNAQLNVLDFRAVEGFAWYLVEYMDNDKRDTGWIQAVTVSECVRNTPAP